MLTAGSALGTLLTGILGSFILDYIGWSAVFRIIGRTNTFFYIITLCLNCTTFAIFLLGVLALCWTLVFRYYTMSSERYRIINVSIPSRLCSNGSAGQASVPWLKLFGKSSFWACVITHACQNNCFYVLLSWLPTYFHDGFPQGKVYQVLCQKL